MSLAVYHPQSSEAQRELEMARDLSEVLIHLARTVGLPIEIVKYIRDEVRASGIRARQALKGHILAGDILRWWLIEEVSYVGLAPVMTVPRLGTFERQRADRWKARRLNWTPRESRFWERLDRSRRYGGVYYGNEYLDAMSAA